MSDADDLTTRVGRLRGEINRYRDRYGDLEELEPLDRLDHAIAVRRARLGQLQKMATEIETEIEAVKTEVAGIERGIEALLGEVLPLIERQFAEAWSPTPVLGYRVWAWSDGEFHGVRTHWEKPELIAVCETTRIRDEIPHSDGRCGRLGCGIYAAKQAGRLLDEFAPALRSSFAVGLIGLAGKVVEHEHGYRGARADVLALAAVDTMRAEFTDDPGRIRALFGGAPIADAAVSFSERRSLFVAIIEYLARREKEQSPWT